MGLFIAPFSGLAVGGGGHGIGDPPPQGVDVDAVGRVPLRLLRKTMNKHKPKYMNIVPPGLFRGAVAPPYSWEPRERDDWVYERPRRFEDIDDSDILGPKAPPQTPKPNYRLSRVLVIRKQIEQLRDEISALMARQHQLVQAAKGHVSVGWSKPVPQAVGAESLDRTGLRLVEDDAEDILGPKVHKPIKRPGIIGPAETSKGISWLNKLDRRSHATEPSGLSRTPIPSISRQRRNMRKQAVSSRLGPPRTVGPAPTQSPEIIQIHNQIQQKRMQISNLVNELRQLRMHGPAESAGLTSNHRSSLRLLLK